MEPFEALENTAQLTHQLQQRWRAFRIPVGMGYLQAAAEWEDLYEARSLTLLWRLSNGEWLLSVSAHKLMVGMEIWIRRDHPDGPPNIQKVSFSTLIESEAYLALKREELESEGWTEERNS